MVNRSEKTEATENDQGYVKIFGTGPASDPYILLCTGSGVNLVLDPITSTAVWGAGWYNAAETAHYADSVIRYEGNIDIELQLGASGAIWDTLQDWISNHRAYPKSFDISPDGARIYQYRTSGVYNVDYGPTFLGGAWNTTANFTTTAGSFVTCSLGLIALDRTEVDPAGGVNFSNYSYIKQTQGVIASDCSVLAATMPLNPDGDNVNPIPFWRTKAMLWQGVYTTPFKIDGTPPQTSLETVEWSMEVTQNHVVLYTCDGNRLPTALLQGPQVVAGSVTLYHQDGVFDPILGPAHTGTLTTPYMVAETTWFNVEIISSTLGNSVFLEMPAVVVETDDYGIKGAGEVTNRQFGLKGLGGRCNAAVTMPPFIMSDSSGAFVTPP